MNLLRLAHITGRDAWRAKADRIFAVFGARLAQRPESLPALVSGVLDVLAPLRLHHLGATSVAIGATFLVAAGVESFISPVAGRLSDRRGRFAPFGPALKGGKSCGPCR